MSHMTYSQDAVRPKSRGLPPLADLGLEESIDLLDSWSDILRAVVLRDSHY